MQTTDALLFEVRAAADEDGVIEGRAVPYGEEIELYPGFRERIEPGAVMAREDIKLFNAHRSIIGKVIESESREDGFYIKARISDTAEGRDTLTLLRDGALNKFSIGFNPVDYRFEDDGDLVVHSKIDVREVSVVAIPAYESAEIFSVRSRAENVREDIPTKEVEGMDDNTVDAAEFMELRGRYEELERTVAQLKVEERGNTTAFYRTGSALLAGLVKGDERALEEYRAYTGGTSDDTLVSDTLKNSWVGDLTKIIDDASKLASFFSTSGLPGKGNHVEYGRFTVSSLAVAATGVGTQAEEGDDLRKMENLKYSVETAPVVTVGGYFEMSRQEIELSPQNVLASHQRVQAIALGKDLESKVRTAYNAARTANAANTITVADGSDWADLQAAIIDAAVLYDGLGFSDFSLIVDKERFKKIAALVSPDDGRPLLNQDTGRVNVKGLTGQLWSIPVVLDLKETTANRATFAVPEALRVFTGGVRLLEDENTVNLTKTFSLYEYVSVAPEHAYLVIPVTFTAN